MNSSLSKTGLFGTETTGAANDERSLDDQITALTALRDGLDSCIGCGCLSLERCTISNPGDTAGAYGPGAAYLPAGLRRSDGRLAGPPGRPHPRG